MMETGNVREQALMELAGRLRAMNLWFHGAHHLTKGTGFSGDHVNLYGTIYTGIAELIDGAIEKAIGLSGCEGVACPVSIASCALEHLHTYQSPVDCNALAIAAAGKQIIADHLAFLDGTYKVLKSQRLLTLGLDDFLMAQANTFETYLYLLGQRVKAELD
jgi:hypothetical protein